MNTIKCKVVADKVWYSKENRYLETGEIVEFPEQVKNHEGKMVPFKVGDSFELVTDKADGKKPKADGKPADGLV